MKKRKLGLVLSGGGAKGAYLFGVWQALKELGIDKLIEGVSGVSIGALTAYMFVTDKYEQTYDLWELSKKEVPSKRSKPLVVLNKLIGKNNEIALDNLTNNLYLSSKKIDKLLEEIIDLDKLKNSPCKCYITCHNVQKKQPESFLLNNYSHLEVKQILKATTAIPILFKKVQLGGMAYYDGGISNNTPISPLYENGYNVIIVVYLDDKGHCDYRLYPNTHFIEISPQVDIGDFRTGVLNFHSSKIDELIRQGYKDAYVVLKKELMYLHQNFL